MIKPTKKQKEIIEYKAGLFVVRACPGSGKTFTVAARLARLLKNWDKKNQGIATISFTNIAWREIEGFLKNEFSVKTPLKYPHFLGTIDSFINKFILLPLGHKILKCNRRPEFIGLPHNSDSPNWSRRPKSECYGGCEINDFYYDIYDKLKSIKARNKFDNCLHDHKYCDKVKRAFLKKGYVTQLDSNFIAFKILQKFEFVATSIINKFPYFLIDEAQDTSQVQMMIVDYLLKAGLSELMLVGDPDQAIYEWRDAEPSLFIDKYEQWNENSVELNENWRSTHNICDFASKISSLKKAMVSCNEELNTYSEEPKVYCYNDSESKISIINDFQDNCSNVNINNIYVLSRAKDLINELNPSIIAKKNLDPWRKEDKITKNIVYAMYLYDKGKFREAFNAISKYLTYLFMENGIYSNEYQKELVGKIGWINWKKEIYSLFMNLPNTNSKLGEWIILSNSILSKFDSIFKLSLKIKQDRGEYKHSQLDIQSLFLNYYDTPIPSKVNYCTIHSVKGMSLDAVIVFVRQKAGSKNYSTVLTNPILVEEELRIIYVAVTRARKKLALAIPQATKSHWSSVFPSLS